MGHLLSLKNVFRQFLRFYLMLSYHCYDSGSLLFLKRDVACIFGINKKKTVFYTMETRCQMMVLEQLIYNNGKIWFG